PYMQELANQTGAAVALGSRDRLNLLYLEFCRARGSVMMRLDMGSRIPLATSAIGRALIAALPEHEREWLLGFVATREGDRWPEIRSGIDRAMQDLATHGFTTSYAGFCLKKKKANLDAWYSSLGGPPRTILSA